MNPQLSSPTRWKLSALALAAALLALTPLTAQAGTFDDLLKAVPAEAGVVVAVDHTAMRKHVHYDGLFRLLNRQGWARPLNDLKTAKHLPGKQITHTISFRIRGAPEVLIMAGTIEVSAIEAYAKATLKKKFKRGKIDAAKWFTLSPGIAISVVDAKTALVGPVKGIKSALKALAAGKSIVSRPNFSKLRKEAAGSKAVVWSVSYISDRLRKALRKQGASDMAHVARSTMQITGTSKLHFKMVGHTENKAGAAEVAGAMNGKIDRKIYKNTLLNALVGPLVRQLSIRAKGKKVTGAMTLTTGQVAVVAKYGARVVQLLR